MAGGYLFRSSEVGHDHTSRHAHAANPAAFHGLHSWLQRTTACLRSRCKWPLPGALRLLVLLLLVLAILVGTAYWAGSESTTEQEHRRRWVPPTEPRRLKARINRERQGNGAVGNINSTNSNINSTAVGYSGKDSGLAGEAQLTASGVEVEARSVDEINAGDVERSPAAPIISSQPNQAGQRQQHAKQVSPVAQPLVRQPGASPQLTPGRISPEIQTTPQLTLETPSIHSPSQTTSTATPAVVVAQVPPVTVTAALTQPHNALLSLQFLLPAAHAALAELASKRSSPASHQSPESAPRLSRWCRGRGSDAALPYHLVVLASPRPQQGRYLATTLVSIAAADARPTSLTVLWAAHRPNSSDAATSHSISQSGGIRRVLEEGSVGSSDTSSDTKRGSDSGRDRDSVRDRDSGKDRGSGRDGDSWQKSEVAVRQGILEGTRSLEDSPENGSAGGRSGGGIAATGGGDIQVRFIQLLEMPPPKSSQTHSHSNGTSVESNITATPPSNDIAVAPTTASTDPPAAATTALTDAPSTAPTDAPTTALIDAASTATAADGLVRNVRFSLLDQLELYDAAEAAALRGGDRGGVVRGDVAQQGGGTEAGGRAAAGPPHLRVRYLPNHVRQGNIMASYYEALLVPEQVAEERGNPSLRELPLVVLEGDVLLAPRFGERLSCLLRTLGDLGRTRDAAKMDGSSETPASTTGSSGAESDSGANPRPPPLPTTSPDFAVSLYIPGMEALEVPIALRLYQESLSLRHDDINLLDEGSEKAVGEGDGSASRDHDQHHDGRGGGGGGSRAAFSRLELLPNSWSWGSQGLLYSYGIRMSLMRHYREYMAGCIPQDGLQDIELVRHMEARQCAGLPVMPPIQAITQTHGSACDPRVLHGNATVPLSSSFSGSSCYLYAARPSLVQHIGASSSLFGEVSKRFHMSTSFPGKVAIPSLDSNGSW